MKRAIPGGNSVDAATTPGDAAAAGALGAGCELDAVDFRRRLMAWYRAQARTLPWRGATDPYHIWVSEIMLQQTRVAAVVAHYNEFVRRFPTLVSLALAAEPDVLAAWSGLGYYRRARMLYKAAQFIVLERDGRLPASSAELRTLPGIGEYTAAAIASIAFGEAVAVVDGNVERVILRLTGQPSEETASDRAFVRAQAQALMPHAPLLTSRLDSQFVAEPASRPRDAGVWDASERVALAASAHPAAPAGGEGTYPHLSSNPAGDHNQAMMELGATICVPRKPLCLLCPLKRDCLGRPRAEEFPVKTRTGIVKREETVAIIRHGSSIYAEQVPEGKPWHGLWRFPDFDPARMQAGRPIAEIKYGITKYAVTMQAVEATWRKRPNGSGVYLNSFELASRAFASPHRKLMARL